MSLFATPLVAFFDTLSHHPDRLTIAHTTQISPYEPQMESPTPQHDRQTPQDPSGSQLLERPSFEVDQVQLQFDLKHGLHHVAVQANKMVLILLNSIIRIDLENPSHVVRIPLPSIGSQLSQITNCWLHENGLHLIVRLSTNTYFYLNDSYTTLKPLPKFKNLLIDNILFFETADSVTTGNFLFSTSDGNIYISSLKSHSDESKRDDKLVKLLFKSPSKLLFWGLSFDKSLNQFNAFTESSQYVWECFDTSYSEIVKVFKSPFKMVSIAPFENKLFVANSTEYLCLSSTNKTHSNDLEIELADTDTLPPCEGDIIDLTMSKHHLIGLDKQKLMIFNKLALGSPPVTIDLSEYDDHFIGLTADETFNTYWVYTNNSIYELVMQNESISVWYNYFKMGQYEEALKCLDDQDTANAFKIDMILIKQGYDLLQRGGFGVDLSDSDEDTAYLLKLQIQGIQTLAKLTEPFEKVSLMLLNHTVNLHSPLSLVSEKLLVEYLLVKFSIAKDVERNKIRVQVLSSWIVELLLRVIYRLQNSATEAGEKPAASTEADIADFNKKFETFVLKNSKHLHRQTIYQIISDLHFTTKLLYYAELIEDWEFMVYYYIDNSEWKNALKVLLKIYFTESLSNSIIYKTANVLLTNYPKGTVDMWLKFSNNGDSKATEIKHEKFLPSILAYNKNNTLIPINENHSIHFLTQLIFDKGLKNKQINNYYLSLLITYPDTPTNVPSALTNFDLAAKQIIKFLNFAQSESNRNHLYDSQFILRLCLSYKHYQAAVVILIQYLNLFEQALKLALDHDFFDLGEFILRKYDEINESNQQESNSQELGDRNQDISKISLQDENYSRRKKLWIMFSKYLINSVCSGKPTNFIRNIEIERTTDVPKNNNTKENGINDITNDMVNSITGQNEPYTDVSLERLNQVLKYILTLANSESKQDFIGLKDLLPLFPENIVINDFKDEIVKSLNQYNNKINQLSLEMTESLTIASNLKQQIKDMTNAQNQGKIYSIIQPGEPCLICGNLLISKNLILFPNCHHGFHKDCLIRNYIKLKNYRFIKIFDNFKSNPSDINKKELDENLTRECWLCNQANINQIDANLIDPVADRPQIIEWTL